MARIVKGLNEKKFAEDDFNDKIKSLPKHKKFFVVTDDDGNIKGYFPLKEKNLGKDWLAMYQNALKALAKWDLSNEEYRVIFALLAETDFENYIRISQKHLSEELNIKQPNISRAIKNLKDRNVIVEGPRAGLNKTYRLNPYIAHKGKKRSETILDFEDALQSSGKSMFDANIK